MQKVRVGVVGVGYLGSLHAEKFFQMDDVELSCIVDILPERRELISQRYRVKGFENYKDIVDLVDAVSISTPTSLHYEIAKFFLENGKDVFVEKPISRTVDEAKELVDMAERKGLILQVGHLERFNGAFVKIVPMVKDPLFVESERLSPFRDRGTDVDVVLDLMIHDIDLISWMVGSAVGSIRAVGVPVLTDQLDMAQAWIEFENGVVANVKASRVSREGVRKLRIFQPSGYISVDFLGKRATFIERRTLSYEVFSGADVDPLFDELKSFVKCVAERRTPVVSGRDGMRALEIAEMIKSEVMRKMEDVNVLRGTHI